MQMLALAVAGALGVESAEASLNITISPSQSIQQNLDAVHNAGGGTLHLKAGTYTISSPIKMYSNITLEGAGQGSTIVQTPSSSFASEIINDGTHASGPVLSNMTIQNMTLDGRGMNALNSMGIQICPASGLDSYLTLNNLEVRNCGQGAGLGRHNHLGLKWNNFHNNGYAVPGSTSLWYQNVYITASQNVNIPGGVCNYSSQGCGLKCGFGGTGYYIDIQANNNARTGIAIQPHTDGDFQNVTIQYCTAGIMLSGGNMIVDSCKTDNNLRWGIRTWGGTGRISNNESSGNATGSGWSDNYGIGSGYTLSNNK
jgi:hypothetical protein